MRSKRRLLFQEVSVDAGAQPTDRFEQLIPIDVVASFESVERVPMFRSEIGPESGARDNCGFPPKGQVVG